MAIDDNDDREYMKSEAPAAAVATPPAAAAPAMNLDAAMAALIKAASPAEAARRASAISGPVDNDSLDEPDFGEFDEDDMVEEVQAVSVAPSGTEAMPVNQYQQEQIQIQSPYQEQASEQPQQHYAEPPQQYAEPPQMQPQPVNNPEPMLRMPQDPRPQMQAEPVRQEQPAQRGSAPRPGRSTEPLRAPAAPAPIPFSRPAEAAPMMKAPEMQQEMRQEARQESRQESNGDGNTQGEKYLYNASRFIYTWLMENQDSDEVLVAATEWVRKHGTAEHNGIALRGVLEIGDDPQVVLLAVRWLTEHTNHEMAPEIVEILAGV